MGGGSQTDDLGQFRLYGLQPGEHAVVAEAMRYNFVQPNAPPETEEDKIGFVTTYYPGTPDEAVGATRARPRSAPRRRALKSGWRRIVSIASPGASSIHKAVRCPSERSGRAPHGGRNERYVELRLLDRRARAVSDAERSGGELPPDRQADSPVHSRTADRSGRNGQPSTDDRRRRYRERAGDDDARESRLPVRSSSSKARRHDARPDTHHGDRPADSDDMSFLQSPQPVVVKPDGTFTMKGLMGEFMLRAARAGPVPQVGHRRQRGHHRQRARIQGDRPRHGDAHVARVDARRERDRRRGRGVHGRRHPSLFGGQGVVAVQLHADQADAASIRPGTSASLV